MDDNVAISVSNVSKIYRIWDSPTSRIAAGVWSTLGKIFPEKSGPSVRLKAKAAAHWRDFQALQDINFEVRRGEAVGIVGRNGSGKSTLLQIIAGTMMPSNGQVEVRGRTAALLELGSGFNPEFTGRENIFLNAAILGLTRTETEQVLDEILAFADIGTFIDQPVKAYSSGMVLRLAFAVQVQINPEILIIDEALAVGDALFQKRCFQKLEKLTANGTTLLFVSHDQESVRTLTQRAVLLRNGRMKATGTSAEVILEYRRQLHEEENAYFLQTTAQLVAKTDQAAPALRTEKMAFGDLDAEVLEVRTTDENRQPKSMFYPGDSLLITMDCRFHRPLTHLSFGIRLRNKEGHKIYSWGTQCHDIAIWAGQAKGPVLWDRAFVAGETVRIAFHLECRLGANLYEVQATIAQTEERYSETNRICHWKDEATFFHVGLRPREYMFNGLVDLKAQAVLEPMS